MALFAKSKQATVYRSYLRGRMRAAGVLPDAEARQYADPTLPTPLLVAFVLGALAEAPLPSEAEVEAEVASRLAAAPPAAPPTEQAERPRWIGDPLPSTGR